MVVSRRVLGSCLGCAQGAALVAGSALGCSKRQAAGSAEQTPPPEVRRVESPKAKFHYPGFDASNCDAQKISCPIEAPRMA